jgi:rod shape determining protein RodA
LIGVTFREIFRRGDSLLVGSAILLGILSLVLLGTSANSVNFGFFLRQALFMALAMLLLVFFAKTHYTFFRTVAQIIFVGLIVLLIIVLQASVIRGAASWLVIGGLHLQPGELAKVILVIVLAKIIAESRNGVADTRVLLKTIFFAGLPISLVMLQPDFGTAVLLLFIWLGMIITAKLRKKQIIILGMVAVLLGVSGWIFFLKPYQKERVMIFLQPGSDPLGSGYTVMQSVTAFGSGGMWGRGLGYGPQSRLNFLPENRTDFIFARIGEELGLIGVTGVLTLYAIILWRMLYAAMKTSDPFGRGLAVGAFVVLLSGVMVNAGMNLGILPVTGVPLPFVSYGGSGLITMFILVGLVESVLIHGEKWEPDDNNDIVPVQFGVSGK